MNSKILSALVLLGVAGAAFAAGAATQKTSTMVDSKSMEWKELAPGSPFKMVTLWGDRSKGEYAMLLKVPAGMEATMHSHTAAYHAVAIEGLWAHQDDGGEVKELPPGSYVMQPGKQFHNDFCKSTTDCVIFVHQHAKGDFIPKPAPKAK